MFISLVITRINVINSVKGLLHLVSGCYLTLQRKHYNNMSQGNVQLKKGLIVLRDKALGKIHILAINFNTVMSKTKLRKATESLCIEYFKETIHFLIV